MDRLKEAQQTEQSLARRFDGVVRLTYWQSATLTSGAQELTTMLNGARELAVKLNTTVCVKTNVGTPGFGTELRSLQGSCTGTAWTGPGTDSSGFGGPLE